MVNFVEIKEATMNGEQHTVAELTREAIKQGAGAEQIIQDSFIAAMSIVGEKFGAGEIYIPEMLRAARAMKFGMEVLSPLIVGNKDHTLAKVVLGTVKGDMHDIGKNLVGMMLEGSGFEVIDLGIDVPANKFVDAVKQYQPQFLAMSALLTTTMEQMKMVIAELEGAGLREQVKVFVGGAPVNRSFADEIGADGHGINAGQAAKSMKKMLN
ncbi:MAG: cobalamin-binding protein [bacterium]|nr:cobalamin-binding protein [bacterium]